MYPMQHSECIFCASDHATGLSGRRWLVRTASQATHPHLHTSTKISFKHFPGGLFQLILNGRWWFKRAAAWSDDGEAVLQIHELQTEVHCAGASYMVLEGTAQVCTVCLAHRLNFTSMWVTRGLLPSSSFLPYAFLHEFFCCRTISMVRQRVKPRLFLT